MFGSCLGLGGKHEKVCRCRLEGKPCRTENNTHCIFIISFIHPWGFVSVYLPQVFVLNLRVFVCTCITGVGLARWLCGGAFIEVGPREHSSPPGFADRKPPSQPPTCCMLSLCLPLSLSACVSAFAGFFVCVFACVFVCVFVYVLSSGFADHKPASQPPSCCMLEPLSLFAPMCLFHVSLCVGVSVFVGGFAFFALVYLCIYVGSLTAGAPRTCCMLEV